MKNIVLIGFMGSGKTVVGKMLSEKLNRKFMDIDRLIEEEQGQTIQEIFSGFGESHFRKLEKDMVSRAVKEGDQVIAAGGGVVLDPENVANLRKNGIIIWLDVSPEAARKRTGGDGSRPLLKVNYPEKTIEELLSFREPLYSQADFKVETSNLSVEEVTSKILSFLEGGEENERCQ
jgi:shikimate kinase